MNQLAKKQSGQAIVLVLLLTVVGVVAALSLLSTGLLTSKKMQLQNAADATAYSVSVIEARDLNFAAYINRSMVANEVAIGQMVSMMSWVSMMRSLPEFVDNYADAINAVLSATGVLAPVGSAIKSTVTSVTTPYRTVLSAVHPFFTNMSKVISKASYFMNKVYSTSQQVMHLATVLFTSEKLFGSGGIPQRNVDPNAKEKPEFSPFGYLALAAHYSSYYGDLVGKPLYNFVKTPHLKRAKSAKRRAMSDGIEGMERLAQVVNDSRDGFTRNRHCSLPAADLGSIPGPKSPSIGFDIGILKFQFKLTPGYKTPAGKYIYPGFNGCQDHKNKNSDRGGWDVTFFGFTLEASAGVNLGIVRGNGQLGAAIRLGADRRGGTALRHNFPETRDAKLGRNPEDLNFSWSAGDVMAMDPNARAWGSVSLGAYIPLVGWRDATLFNLNINLTPLLPKVPVAAGAGLASSQTPDVTGLPKDNLSSGRENIYGEAHTGRQILGWDTPFFPIAPPPTPGKIEFMRSVSTQVKRPYVISKKNTRQTNESYKLHTYIDTADKLEIGYKDKYTTWGVERDELFLGLEAPYILIALTMNDVVPNANKAKGNFELDTPRFGILDSKTPNVFGAIGKAEVYYSRPSGLSYFSRKDGREEKQNAFNPYWDARLVDSSFIDRNAALIFQHLQAPLPKEINTSLESMKSIVETIL